LKNYESIALEIHAKKDRRESQSRNRDEPGCILELFNASCPILEDTRMFKKLSNWLQGRARLGAKDKMSLSGYGASSAQRALARFLPAWRGRARPGAQDKTPSRACGSSFAHRASARFLPAWRGGGSPETASVPKQEAQSVTRARSEIQLEWFHDLEVPPGSDLKTVRRAWKQQLARHHRDLMSEDVETKRRATLATNRINTAYRALQDALS